MMLIPKNYVIISRSREARLTRAVFLTNLVLFCLDLQRLNAMADSDRTPFGHMAGILRKISWFSLGSFTLR